MIILEEPIKSLNPEEWLVYSDWLEDYNNLEKANIARVIAKGLKITNGLVYLCYNDLQGTKLTSTLCREPIGQDKHLLSLTKNYDAYFWSECVLQENSSWRDNVAWTPTPISILSIPEIANVEDLCKKYWDKIYEIGSRNDRDGKVATGE